MGAVKKTSKKRKGDVKQFKAPRAELEFDDFNVGDKVVLLTHKDNAVYEVHGVQFIYSDFSKGEGMLHVRLVTNAHKQKWFALVPVSDIRLA